MLANIEPIIVNRNHVLMKSFYDLDYIIDINEKRLEQYDSAYQKVLEKFTHILIVYSAQAIFLVPIIQTLFFSAAVCSSVYYVSFYAYLLLFLFSLYHTIRLILPTPLPCLEEPRRYYKEMSGRLKKQGIPDKDADVRIKYFYINELEKEVGLHGIRLWQKARAYNKAFTFSLLASAPFLVCLCFHLSIKEDKKLQVAASNNLIISFNNCRL